MLFRSDLTSVIRAYKPTMLIGTSGEPGAFTEEAIREMAAHTARPLVLPMSNPTSKCEAKPLDILIWSEGRALVATGSPSGTVSYGGREFRIGQGNNVFIFPGVGLGVMTAEVREVTDGLFAAAARQLAEEVSLEDLQAGSLFPPTSQIRRVTKAVAAAVVRAAQEEGVANRVLAEADIPRAVADAMWDPAYLPMDSTILDPSEVGHTLARHS